MKKFFIMLIFSLLCVAVGLAMIFARPQLLINDFSLARLKELAPLLGVDVTWASGEARAGSADFWHKRIDVKFAKLCIREEMLHGCFDRLAFGVTFDFSGFDFAVEEIGPVDIESHRMVFTGFGTRAAAEPTDDSLIPSWLEKAQIHSVGVVLENLIIDGEAVDLTTGWQITMCETAWRLRAAVKSDHAAFREAQGTVTIAPPPRRGMILTEVFQLELALSAQLADRRSINVSGTVGQQSAAAHDYQLAATMTQGAARSQLQIKGVHGGGALDMQVAAQLRGLGYLDLVDFRDCTFWAKVPRSVAAMIDYAADCEVYLERTSFANRRVGTIPLPKSGVLRTKSHGKLPPLAAPLANFATAINFQLQPIQSEAYDISGAVDLETKGSLKDFPANIDLSFNLQNRIEFPDFQRLTRGLEATAWSIPAPFDQLRGSVTCQIEGRTLPIKKILKIPLRCTTNLAAQPQRVFLDVVGNVTVPLTDFSTAKLDLLVLIKDVQLQLPSLKVQSRPPQIMPDKRFIRAAAPAPAAAIKLTYNVRVKTSSPTSLRLLTNLGPQPMPIAIDVVSRSDESVQGFIRVGGTPLVLARRTIDLKFFQIDFGPTLKESTLKGNIILSHTDYTIAAKIAGTIEEPTVQLTSVPPLNDRQILAIVIFGKEMQELDDGSMRSVDETKAAVADGAIGLISMYYLASTPVERVGYNPHTGIYTASFRLGKTVSLTLGSNWEEEKQAGLSKRLGRNWALTAEVTENAESQQQRSTAMLEWSKRY